MSDFVKELAQELGEEEDVVQETLNVQRKIKQRGIRGIRFMGKSAEKMQKVGPMMTKREIQREMRKRFGR